MPFRRSSAFYRKCVGEHAEDAVADYLFARGFQLLARNLRLGHLEIGLVARRASTVVVVEVRARSASSFETGFGSITRRKRDRILRAARRLWADRLHRDPSVDRLRIDAASVVRNKRGTWVDYQEGAITE